MTSLTTMRKPQLVEECKRLTDINKELEDKNNELKNDNESLKEVIGKGMEEKKLGESEILLKAKKFGLFKYNRSLKQYEIVIPVSDFEKI